MGFWKAQGKGVVWIAGGFLVLYAAPIPSPRVETGLLEAVRLAHWYAREHVLLCLVPAFLIAGAIAVFVRQASVVRYLGAGASRVTAYAVASVSGTILAVCSCTVLPLFAGIYRRGAGLGPATAFLYSGPAINVLAIILTARVLGMELGVARAVGAIAFSVIIGLLMQALFRNDVPVAAPATPAADAGGRPAWKDAAFVAAMVGVLVFANWGAPSGSSGVWAAVKAVKWPLTIAFVVAVAAMLSRWYSRGEAREWVGASWDFTRQIMPLLLAGVLVAGFLLGRPGHEGVIPASWVAGLVGGNSVGANVFASVVGAFMYFATLTEIPILQGLIGAGMGKGPALALLLAGPALSLPNMLVIRSVLGTKRTVTFVALVVVMAAASGMIFGAIAG